jgi:hypothetical protein
MADGPDYKLRSQVDTVQKMIVQVDQQISRVGNEVSAVSAAQRQTHSDLAQLRADFLAFTQTAERRAAVQRAETRIGVLQDTLEHQFGHHKVVRRTAVGLLQAFDVGLVSEDAVQSVSEQLMIQTPRYWLAPALVALSAWSSDERELCERAVAEAYRRSPTKTSLLFTLVLRRQQRIDSSARWLQHYLRAQDPKALGRDFAVILEAVAQGAFGPAGRAAVDATLASWSEALSNADSHAEQVRRWRAEVESLQAPRADADFPALATISPEWPQLGAALSGAEGHQPLLEKYRALMAEVVQPQDRIEDAMDDILDRLVSEYDNEELPIQSELAYNRAVIDRDGDVAAARNDATVGAAAFEETLDYLTIQTLSALDPGSIGVSRATQKIAVASCRPWFGQAHDQATSAYRQQLPDDVSVGFAGNHNMGATVFQLPDWNGRLSAGLPQLEQSLGNHWDTHTAAYIDSLAFPVAKKVIGPALITLVVAIVLISISPVFGLLATLVVGGIFAFRLNQQYQQSLTAQAQARELLTRWKQESLTQLRAASAELTDWGSRFERADSQAEGVRAFIASLDTAGATATPYETRTIHTGAHRAGALT